MKRNAKNGGCAGHADKSRRKPRNYDKRYMCFGFADVFVSGERRRRCVICQKTVSAESLKPNNTKRHLEICHADLAKQTSKCFSSNNRWNTKT